MDPLRITAQLSSAAFTLYEGDVNTLQAQLAALIPEYAKYASWDKYFH